MGEHVRVVSYGGGVQSTALLVLAAQGRINFRTFLFCNVGDDSEHPATLRYVREVAVPYAAAHEIGLHELRRSSRDGRTRTLYADLVRDIRSVRIPVKMAGTGAPGTRSCTGDYKIKVIRRWLQEHGATGRRPAIQALGISVDEIHRARTGSGESNVLLDYPLIRLRMDRNDCAAVIRAAGLPVPPKSACWFCPMKTAGQWQRQREEEPDLFAKSVALEALLNARRQALGKDEVYFHRRLVPLAEATSPNQQHRLFEDSELESCESGYCMV